MEYDGNNALLGMLPFLYYGSNQYSYMNMCNSLNYQNRQMANCINTQINTQMMSISSCEERLKQQINMAYCQSKINQMTYDSMMCCCQASSVPIISTPKEEQKDMVYELDKIFFPDDPIREYIEEEIRKVKEKYKRIIEKLELMEAKYGR